MAKPKIHLRLQDEQTGIVTYPCGNHVHWVNREGETTRDTVHVSNVTCLICYRYAKKISKQLADYETRVLVTANPDYRIQGVEYIPKYGPHLDLKRRLVDPQVSLIRALNYPTRRYTSTVEIEVGDIVRCVEDDFGNPAFDDCIISGLSGTHATLERPHMTIRGRTPVVETETLCVGKQRLFTRFVVLTHGHSGHKDNRRLPEVEETSNEN